MDYVWRTPVRCKSNFARDHAVYIAMAASMQLITTRIAPDRYGNEWQATAKGLRWLSETE